MVEALDAFVIADPMTDAALPDAPRIDATMDAFSPPDAATSGRCLDPRAELTSEGCAIPSATACTPFSPCPTGYSCTATAMGDRCRCDDQALCGPRCSSLVACTDARFPVCHLGQCDAPRGCLGNSSASVFCGSRESCYERDHECVPRGLGLSGDVCSSPSDCSTSACVAGRCGDACTSNASCSAGACVEDFFEANQCVVTTMCMGCSGPEMRCTRGIISPVCVESCNTTSDCSTGTCRIRNATSLEPFCEVTTLPCGPNELQIDTDSGRRQACVRRVSCFVDADCMPGETCVAAAYGGLGNPVTLCGRVL